jgi:DNA-binding MarR family transcriptional regulator
MTGSPSRREASEAMVRAGRAVGNASAMLNHAVAERLGIDPTAWECVTLLFEHGPVAAGRLAELTGLTTGAVTGLVDRLEAAGYVRRQRDPVERRRVIVDLVPSAVAGVMPLFEPMLGEMHASHGRYTDEEMAAIVACLRDAADILRRHALRLRAETAEARRASPNGGR